ncbi:MAG: NAD+ synthase [Candidatus Omnitrophota bacterium]|nr:NAD+ synthase [Candidatus Omnitrophota bacterium]
MKQENLRIAMAQINCLVGDLQGNFEKICANIKKAESAAADIVVFPEMALTGYPPEDLLLKPKFITDNLEYLKKITKLVRDTVVIAGFVDRKAGNIYNSLAVIYRGKIAGIYHKMRLPNYGVFDEERYFEAGENPSIFKLGKCLFGVSICEDIWHLDGPIKLQADLGAKLIFNSNASPYYAGKIKEREEIVKKQARLNNTAIVYTNLVGGQDELVFDGQSIVVDNKGRIITRAEAFKEDLLIVDLDIPVAQIKRSKKIIALTDALPSKNRIGLPKKEIKPLEPIAEIYQALILGVKDYINKNGFKKVVIGLSGGIDSALVATLAVDAIGKDNVTGVFMPSRYSSAESETDARELAQNLGTKFSTIPIEQMYAAYLAELAPHFSGLEANIAEENLQARIRGNLLMALSNKFGWLVLTTGNKSEMSTGYATLYGDMAGGFAVIKDVPKTLVYKLAKYRNSLSLVIPERVFSKEPTAELKPNQKDSDTLPVYEKLDPILKAYIEEDKDLGRIVSLGFDSKVVAQVLSMVDKSEYKRRQSPPGIKITPKSFGKDRRMPITNKYKNK